MLDELFKCEGQSIFSFKKGDIIVRVEPAIHKSMQRNENLGIEIEVVTGKDNSFREPMEFIAVENNTIYLRYAKNKRLTHANLEEHEDGWQLFKIPDGLTMDEILKSYYP